MPPCSTPSTMYRPRRPQPDILAPKTAAASRDLRQPMTLRLHRFRASCPGVSSWPRCVAASAAASDAATQGQVCRRLVQRVPDQQCSKFEAGPQCGHAPTTGENRLAMARLFRLLRPIAVVQATTDSPVSLSIEPPRSFVVRSFAIMSKASTRKSWTRLFESSSRPNGCPLTEPPSARSTVGTKR